ncbi:unnamed protein product [Didymodactylos carnosus]|uniref:Uncharacterized protein n=1 Tax=Didymodactylos carnosus TaxID=1234261 RepID=A0A813UEM8_9BILA|nr:unnamed protein product [Didymodactylos carnosus]CAF3608909.1 unnamed protein product [Didymodactylos carnosus]
MKQNVGLLTQTNSRVLILHGALRIMPLSAVGDLPTDDTLLRTIQRQKKPVPLGSNSRLPDALKKTDRGEFVLYESNDMIIFMCESNLQALINCKYWFADRIFSVRQDDVLCEVYSV